MGDNLKIEYVGIDSINPYPNNAKLHPAEQIEQIKRSIEEFGMNDPIGVWHDEVVEGHGRLIACKELGFDNVPIIRLDDLDDEQRRAYMLVHNQLTMNSGFDTDMLNIELESIDIDMKPYGLDVKQTKDVVHEKLTDKFIAPPFSVLDTRQGYWQERKKQWFGIGIESEKGRSDNITFSPDLPEYANNGTLRMAVGTSVFDPVLCEIMYKWFNIDGGLIYDCFAGGSVRGIVAAKLGYKYLGIDLSKNQIRENQKQAEIIGVNPTWYCDDSSNADKYIENASADMVFTCPPYADLEVYSDDPRDISNMDYDGFQKVYKYILQKACAKLKDNRFAVVVIGDVRDKNGAYRNLVDYTKQCINDCGLHTYNEFILVEQIGTGALRAKKQFESGRKAVKTHQNVLVFYKGNPKNIKKHFAKIDLKDLDIEKGD